MFVKSWIQRVSIARKLTGIGIITSVSSLVMVAAVLLIYDRSNSRADILGDTLTMAEIVGTNSTAALAFGDAKAANETLRVVAVN